MEIKDLRVSPSVRETASEDGAVLLDTEQGICFSLNPDGLRIWEMVKKEYSVDQISDALEQELHAPRAVVLSDVSEFVQSLRAKHLLLPREPENHKHGRLSWLFRGK